jgi:hypothetical protein
LAALKALIIKLSSVQSGAQTITKENNNKFMQGAKERVFEGCEHTNLFMEIFS